MAAVTSGTRPSRRWRSETGAELIEFALIFPTLLLVILGIIDFGFLFQRYEVVTNAAREGARIAILPGYTTADVQARVNAYLTAGGVSGGATVSVGAESVLPLGSGRCVIVRAVNVDYPNHFMFLGPMLALMGGSGVADRTLRATSSMRSEMPAVACP